MAAILESVFNFNHLDSNSTEFCFRVPNWQTISQQPMMASLLRHICITPTQMSWHLKKTFLIKTRDEKLEILFWDVHISIDFIRNTC